MERDERAQWDAQGGGGRGGRGWGRQRRGPRGPHGDVRNFSAPPYGPGGADRVRWAEVNAARQIHMSLFQLGEVDAFDAASELPKVCAWLETQAAEFPTVVLSAFRIMTTEQPHKLPLTAAVVGHLALAPGQAPTSEAPSLGMRIVDFMIGGFLHDLEAHYWRNLRLTLHFFVALVPLGIVSPSSLRSVLQAFTNVLSSDGVDREVADSAADCVLETMCRAGTDLLQPEQLETAPDEMPAKEQLDHLVDALSAYDARRIDALDLVSPFAPAPDEYDFLGSEGFTERIQALQVLQTRAYQRPAFLPSVIDVLPTTVSVATSAVPPAQRVVRLPDVHVSPVRSTAHDHEHEHPPGDTGKGDAEINRAMTGPPPVSRAARWFGASVPAIGSPSGVVLRALVHDLMDLYVMNRKECAHLLLALPLWLRRGTFGGKVSPTKGLFGDEDQAWTEAVGEGPWSLEDFVLESALSTMLLLPFAPQPELYYSSLLREVVSAAPQHVAPSIGRTIRRLYAASGAGLVHAEVLRRLADWFSVHLSNFNFTWAWSEWAEDMSRPWPQARRAFARRVVELEVRLAYYDRIKSTIPPDLEPALLPANEPAPQYAYGADNTPHHAPAMQLFNSLKAKASVQVVQADLQSFRESIVAPPTDVPDDEDDGRVATPTEAERVVRDMAVQTLLNAGSRSFSHLLNVMERYHELLRALSQTPTARLEILASTARFWENSPQWVLIVVDKLLQYRIVEPGDVVTFVFADRDAAVPQKEPFSFSADATELGGTLRDWSSFNWWALLRLTVDKVLGRVALLRGCLQDLQQSNAPGDVPGAPATAEETQVHLDAILLDQRKVLTAIVEAFVRLTGADAPRTLPEDADAQAWQSWWVAQWYRAFVALYHRVLMENRETVLANVFASVPGDHPCLRAFEEACTMRAQEP